MKPKDIFGLIVRLVGLIFLYNAAEKVPLALSATFSGFKGVSGNGFLNALFMVGWPLAVAVWMLRGAPPISRLAYPDESKSSDSRV
jgi:hypothetical protein